MATRYFTILFLALFVLAGCASRIPSAILAAPAPDLTVAEARADLSAHRGQQVRWGGSIAGVENGKDVTRIEIVARDLEGGGRPRETDASGGRFIAHIAGFLDPAIYARDRLLTVSGVLDGSVTKTVGDYPYSYPVVRVQEYQLWRPLPPRDAFPRDTIWYDPWYPWWHRRPYLW